MTLPLTLECVLQVSKEADADIVVIPYWVDLLCRMSQESDLLWDEFNKVRLTAGCAMPLSVKLGGLKDMAASAGYAPVPGQL